MQREKEELKKQLKRLAFNLRSIIAEYFMVMALKVLPDSECKKNYHAGVLDYNTCALKAIKKLQESK